MNRSETMRSFCAVVVLLVCIGLCGAADSDIVVTNAKRELDLTSQFCKESTALTLKNNGAKTASELKVAFLSDRLSFLSVQDESGNELEHDEGNVEVKDGVTHTVVTITLQRALAPKDTIALDLYGVFTQVQTPHPSHVTQVQRQHVVYEDSHYIYSPYTVEKQRTSLALSGRLESHTDGEGKVKTSGSSVEYGSYRNIKPFTVSPMRLHFENNSPFITADSLEKEIEVSHWGNIAVTEHYNVRHSGAVLKGGFSRFEFMHGIRGNAVEQITLYLPAGADEVYYRDDIGNVTSSHLSTTEEGDVKLELIPRYVMFGGWKIDFLVGYNLPASSYLGTANDDSSLYVLNITFVPEFEAVDIAKASVRVILPEGATDIQTHFPFKTVEKERGVHKTYLDTEGRPTLRVEKYNLVPEHNEFFQVTYRFPSSALYHEPFLLMSAYFCAFVMAIVLVRVKLNIGDIKGVDMKVFSKAVEAQDTVNNAMRAYDEALPTRSDASQMSDYRTASTKMSGAWDNYINAMKQEEKNEKVAALVRALRQRTETRYSAQKTLHSKTVDWKTKKKGKETDVAKLTMEYEEEDFEGDLRNIYQEALN